MTLQTTFQDEMGRRYAADSFTYTVSVASLAPGTTINASINTEGQSEFVWTRTNYFVCVGNAEQEDASRVIPRILMGITDSSTATNLQNVQYPISNLAGHEGLPLNLSLPKLIPANTNLRFDFTNFSSATTYTNLFVSLIGYKKRYLS